jgi:predicted DCC family thiol-disulfide oxidoreductase YuxK
MVVSILKQRWDESTLCYLTAQLLKMEVLRRVYETLGMGWVYAVTKLPIIGSIVDGLYEIWANRRLSLTGRSNLAKIAAERQKRIECKFRGAVSWLTKLKLVWELNLKR